MLQRIRARDCHGNAALEFVLVTPIMLTMLLAVVDIGTAAIQFISGYTALRGVAAYAIYHPPADITNPAGWLSVELPAGVTVSHVWCGEGEVKCTADTAAAIPKWFQLSVSVSVSAVLLTSLAGTYPITYSNRFQ